MHKILQLADMSEYLTNLNNDGFRTLLAQWNIPNIKYNTLSRNLLSNIVSLCVADSKLPNGNVAFNIDKDSLMNAMRAGLVPVGKDEKAFILPVQLHMMHINSEDKMVVLPNVDGIVIMYQMYPCYCLHFCTS